MKTIILCGGKGTRLHEETEFKPKPMVMIGDIPMLLHIMHIYATYGHKDFILCLGYKGNMIREYFLHLTRFTNDLELNLADNSITFLNHRIQLDYRLTFVETGLDTNSGDRVRKAAHYIKDDAFMVTYGDGIGNINIDALITHHQQQIKKHKTLATLTAAHPSSKYGQIVANKQDVLQKFMEKPKLHDFINAGFMVLTKPALQYLKSGDALEDGLERLSKARKVSQYRHEGFWHGMDTMKDVIYLNELWQQGAPWKK
jgi:glucose-1-phosphate cytidylyltransferase